MEKRIQVGKHYKLSREYIDRLKNKPQSDIVKVVSIFNNIVVFTDKIQTFSVKLSNFALNVELTNKTVVSLNTSLLLPQDNNDDSVQTDPMVPDMPDNQDQQPDDNSIPDDPPPVESDPIQDPPVDDPPIDPFDPYGGDDLY